MKSFGPGMYARIRSSDLDRFIKNWERREVYHGGPLPALVEHEEAVWGVQACGLRSSAQKIHDALLGDAWELAGEEWDAERDTYAVTLRRKADGAEVQTGWRKFSADAHGLAVLYAYRFDQTGPGAA